MAQAIAGANCVMRVRLDGGIALAETLAHPASLAFSVGAASVASWIGGDYQRSAEYAERFLSVAHRYAFGNLTVLAEFMVGLSEARSSDSSAGLRRCKRCFEIARTQSFLSVFPTVALAEVLVHAGEREAALKLVADTLSMLPDPRSGAFVSELWRLRGELAASEPDTSNADAETYLRTALQVASRQGAHRYRLRTLVGLANLMARTNRPDAARLLVAEADLSKMDSDQPERTAYAQIVAELSM
jgi:hypothetical protein